MDVIAGISGQVYVPNMYASEAKDAIAKSKAENAGDFE
jgi:hypothetical protein